MASNYISTSDFSTVILDWANGNNIDAASSIIADVKYGITEIVSDIEAAERDERSTMVAVIQWTDENVFSFAGLFASIRNLFVVQGV